VPSADDAGQAQLGAERIRGELLKLGLQVCKSNILKQINQVREPRSPKQTWATFLRNHASEIRGGDLVQTCDVFLRTLFVLVADTSSSS
jgi:hypothetical protein